jgi:trehalose-phosphatase
LEGKRIAVFLDYDGTLTPIVDRPDLAVMSDTMRAVVHALAERCPVAVVSGRDRGDVEKLVGLDNLVYAGSHGFDIAGPNGYSIQRMEGEDYHALLDEVIERLHGDLDPVEGALIEPKKSSVAVHYRLVAENDLSAVEAAVNAVLADHPELRVMPGKMVYEIQPRLDWDKGKAVLWLLEALHLDGDDVIPIYMGDDVTDEDAFRALRDRGIGVFVGDKTNPETDHPTMADYIVRTPDDAGRLLDTLGN